MTNSEYAVLAQRTASTKTRKDKLGHGCLGLIGEAGEIVDIIKKMKYMGMTEELAREKLIDESGDFLWYMVEICAGMNISFEDVMEEAPIWNCFNESLEEAAVNICWRVSDMHNIDIREMMENIDGEDLGEIASCLLDVLEYIHVGIDEVKEKNIEKLKKRYPDGFSAERSNERYGRG